MEYSNPVHFNEEVYQYVGNTSTPITHALAGITFPDPSYEIIYNNPTRYSIEYVYEGEGVVQLGSKIFKVQAGDFFILTPNTYHHYYSNRKNPWKKIFFVVDLNIDFVKSLISLYDISDIVFISGAKTPFLLEDIFKLVKNDDGNIHRRLENLSLNLIAQISDFVKNSNIPDDTISKATKYIDICINSRITIKQISEHVNLQYDYFSRLFKKSVGISPSEYIKKEKIKRAKIILSTTNIPIEQVALSLSYTDKSHFTHVFCKECGTTPTKYRLQSNALPEENI